MTFLPEEKVRLLAYLAQPQLYQGVVQCRRKLRIGCLLSEVCDIYLSSYSDVSQSVCDMLDKFHTILVLKQRFVTQ